MEDKFPYKLAVPIPEGADARPYLKKLLQQMPDKDVKVFFNNPQMGGIAKEVLGERLLKAKTPRIAEAFAKSKDKDKLAATRVWVDSFIARQPVVLGRPQHSSLHLLEEQLARRSPEDVRVMPANYIENCVVFLIKHDWARLLKDNTADDGEVLLPYDRCAFEMELNGHRVIAVYHQDQFWLPVIYIRLQGEAWVTIQLDLEGKCVWPYVNELVRATLIVMEAKVAEAGVVRAPERLNKQRLKNSLPPLRDYHVVDLSKRHRVKPADMPATLTDRRRPRLHFRRSHWRYYDTYRVKIPWTLAGDPELGWVDKEYRI